MKNADGCVIFGLDVPRAGAQARPKNHTVITMTLLLAGCYPGTEEPAPESSGPPESIEVGGLYAFPTEDENYVIYKVLVLDQRGVYIRQFSNTFSEPPLNVDPSTLRVGTDLGFDHVHFLDNSPTLLMVTPVTKEELASYERYLRG